MKLATSQVAQDMDLELFRAFVGLQVDGDSLKSDDWTGYAARTDAWRAAATSPAVVREVLLVDREATALRLRRWDETAERFFAAEWTPDLAPLGAQFQAALAAWAKGSA